MTQKVPRRLRRRRQAMRKSNEEFQRRIDAEANWFIFIGTKDRWRHLSVSLARRLGKRMLDLFFIFENATPIDLLDQYNRNKEAVLELSRQHLARYRKAYAPPHPVERPQRMTIIDDH